MTLDSLLQSLFDSLPFRKMTGAKVDFNKILDRVSSGLVGVDSTTTQINKSTKGHVYLPGLPTLYEQIGRAHV